LKRLRQEVKEREKEFVRSASVIGVTLSKAAMYSLIYSEAFDVVIVDESSMAYVPQIAFARSENESSSAVTLCSFHQSIDM